MNGIPINLALLDGALTSVTLFYQNPVTGIAQLGAMVSMSALYSRSSRRLVAGFPPRRPGFEPGSGHVGFVVDKVALEEVFSEYFGFPCQFSFHPLLHIHYHLSSGAGTTGQLAADVPSGLSLTPTQESKKKKIY
jgi:hypothetical protein